MRGLHARDERVVEPVVLVVVLVAARRVVVREDGLERRRAVALALVPPQNEMGYNDFMASMDRDWHLPTTFRAGGVLVRLEHRVTGAKVEGGPLQVRNESYHVSINHTHVGAAYGYV